MDSRKLKTGKLKGFTLLELIIVIAIIVILMSIAIPSINAYIRNSKMRDANSQAQQVYIAAQSYLNNLQARGIKAENYFGEKNNEGYVGVDYSLSKSHSSCSAGSGGCGRKSGDDLYICKHDIKLAGVDSTGTSISAEKAAIAANGIAKNLSENFEGSWIVVIYPKTYTVKYAVCSTELKRPKSSGSSFYNWEAVAAVGSPLQTNAKAYNSIYKVGSVVDGAAMTINGVDYRHSNVQEYDADHYVNVRYTGQYPVPATVKSGI